MIIHKIRMVNFRGFCDKTLDFNNKSVVLLSAANGIGKTTTVDAIEWCLTGNIGRLKTAFDTRSTNDDDRKRNTDGILMNRDTDGKAKVEVILWLFDGEKEIIICREQTRDELDPALSTVTLNGNKKMAEAFIRKYVGDSFYNFHFCDVQKSFNIQNKKRKDLKMIFSEFITNYDEQKLMAENIELFAEDVDRYIEDKAKQKVVQAIIDDHEKQLVEARKGANKIPYPATNFYPDEKTDIIDLSEEALINQKEKVINCGYMMAKKGVNIIVENEALKSQCHVIKNIASDWKIRGEHIQRAVKAGFLNDTDIIEKLEEKLRQLKRFQLSRATIFQDCESIVSLENAGFKKPDFNKYKKNIEDKEKNINNLLDEIDLLTKNNKMLKLLSFLSANKQVVIEHRDVSFEANGVAKCPICGSESFSTMEEDLILEEAEEYIKQNGEIVKVKEVEKNLLKSEVDSIYQKIINRAKSIVEQEKQAIEKAISDLQNLKDEVQPYFDKVKRLQKSINTINVENLTAEKVGELLFTVEDKILEESEEHKIRNTYQQILMVLGYKFETDTVQQTYAKLNNIITFSYEVSNFSYELFVSKLNAIDSILKNQRLNDLNRKLEKERKKNQKIDAEIRELQKLKGIASQRAKDIEAVVEKLSKDEYEKVGPALSKFYNKLTRFNSSDGINLVQENDGISLVDNKGKNIVNVLSNGQISVFILAHFFAGINARNAHEKMKVYFIDDLTACMDDVNMLAFMDLLKYQMSSKATMEQLFFITCDDRISKLLKYKLNGRGIELCELVEENF